MSKNAWLPGRLVWVLGCALGGALAAVWLAQPVKVTRAQDGVASAEVDPRWLALLIEERGTLDRPAEVEGPAAGALTLNVLVQDASVAGFAPTGAPVSIVVRQGSAPNVRTIVSPALTEAGWIYSWAALSTGYFISPGFSPGDVVEVIQGAQTLSLTVADFRAEANVSTNRVNGVAAPDAVLAVHLMSALDPTQVFTAPTTADGSGRFDVDLTAQIDMLAGDFGYVRHALDSARSTTARLVAPQIQAQIGNDLVSGFVAPYQSVSVRVLSGETIIASSQAVGAFDGGFLLCLAWCTGPNASLAVLLPGRQVVLTAGDQVLTTTLPALSAQADRPQQQVTGLTAAGATVSVLRWPGPLPYSMYSTPILFDPTTVATASATGAYTATVPLQVADYGAVVVHDVNGHLAFARFAVPHLRVVLNQRAGVEGFLSGQLDRFSSPVTLTVIGASGLPKAEIAASTSTLGQIVFGSLTPGLPQSGIQVSSGDVISITDPGGLSIHIPLQGISVTADVQTQRISGHGPISATLPINLMGVDPYPVWPHGYETSVLSDLAGFFGLDLVDVRLKSYTRGTISWTNPEGHTIAQTFSAERTCLPEVDDVVVNGNTFWYTSPVDLTGCGSHQVFSLTSSAGVLKYTSELPTFSSYAPYDLKDGQGVPILVAPGDTLTFLNSTHELTMSVPLLSVTIDPSTDRVTGRAPAGARVTLTGHNPFAVQPPMGPVPQWTQVVVADSNGDFHWAVPVQAGDRVEAKVANRMGTSFMAVAVVPAIEWTLYQSVLAATLPPLSPVTITLQSTRWPTATVYSGMTTDRGEIPGTSAYNPPYLPWSIQPGDRVVVQAGVYQRDWTIPTLTADLNVMQSTVQGEAPANHRLLITSFYDAHSVTTQSNSSGRYQVFVPSNLNSATGLKITLLTVQDDRFVLLAGAMSWRILVNSPCVEFRTPRAVGSATLTLADAHGLARETQTLSGYLQTFWQVCFNDAIRPGDRLSLMTEAGSWAFAVPTLTAVHDPYRGAVTGTTPAAGYVTLTFNPNDGTYFSEGRTVSVGSSGRFGIDINDVVWLPGQRASLLYTDPAGNTVQQAFVLTGIQHWLPIIGHP